MMIKWMLGLGAAFLALLFILAALLLRQPAIEPYVPAKGQTVRDVVTGTWTWGTGKDACAGATHTYSFSEDGRVMTLVSRDSVVPTMPIDTTVYDIVGEGPSFLTGAIRGETRMRDDGKPVVWDLVLTGPDAYAWHRTDWPEGAGTARIRRCGGEAAAKE